MDPLSDEALAVLEYTEGAFTNVLVQAPELKVVAHLQFSTQATDPTRVTIAMPAGKAAFRFATSPAVWTAHDVRAVADEVTGQRGISCILRAERPSVSLYLESVTLHHLLRVRMLGWGGAGAELQAYEDEFRRLLRDELGSDERAAVWARTGTDLADVVAQRGRVIARLEQRAIEFSKQTWTGQNNYLLRLAVPPECTMQAVSSGDGTLPRIEISGPTAVQVHVTATTDFPPLTPLALRQLLNERGKRLAASDDEFAASLRRLRFLVFEEKFLAGSWFYLSYFGRDTLIALRQMWPVLSAEAKAAGFRGVLTNVAANGIVNTTDEWSDEMAITHAIGRFNWEYKSGDQATALDTLASILTNAVPARAFLDVLDPTFLFPTPVKRWLDEQGDEAVREWLTQEQAVMGRRESHLATLLRNWSYVLTATLPYVQGWEALSAQYPDLSPEENLEQHRDVFDRLATRLVRSFPHTPMGNWRDTTPLPGYARFPEDINANLIPLAIASIAGLLARVTRLGLEDQVQRIMDEDEPAFSTVRSAYFTGSHRAEPDPQRLATAEHVWRMARQHYVVHQSPHELRRRVRDYLDGLERDEVCGAHEHERAMRERDMLLHRVVGTDERGPVTIAGFVDDHRLPAGLQGGLRYPALVLDEHGYPVPVMHSDDVFTLLFGMSDQEQVRTMLPPFFLPYPLGLGFWDDQIGFVICNAVVAPHHWGYDDLWAGLRPSVYHVGLAILRALAEPARSRARDD
jgi:hypothetical protein